MAMVSVPVSEKYLLTVKEAATYYGIPYSRLRRWVASDIGDFVIYTGSHCLINKKKFVAFVYGGDDKCNLCQ